MDDYMAEDCMRDPAIPQVVKSPGNTQCEAMDAHERECGDEMRASLPAEARRSGRMNALFGPPVRIRVARVVSSRR